jgi:hypothetical protein
VVYLARDRVIDRTVALKVIEFGPSLGAEVRREMGARSEREAKAVGALNHPHIVTIHDAGRGADDSSFFIVMEYVDGETLSSRLERGPLPPAEAVRIGGAIASALEYAHSLGIVHRDVKPANILIRKDGVAKIVDFGVARFESSDLTQAGQWVGSPAYMSPEQALGRPADARSDVFALGVVLYEVLTGSRPFSAETLAGLSYQIIHEAPVPPSSKKTELDPRWDRLILKAMAKSPEARQGSAADLAAGLESLAPSADAAGSPALGSTVTGGRSGTLEVVEGRGGSGPASRATRRRRGRFPWGRIAVSAVAITAVVAIILGIQAIGPAAAGTATLKLNVVHGLESGEVRVGVDGRPVWVQSIRAAEERTRLSSFARRFKRSSKGRATGEVLIPAGDSKITVSVISDEGRWTQMTSQHLDPGSIGTLNIKVRTGRTTGMELKWIR